MKNSFKKLSKKGLAVTICASIAVIGGAGIYSYTKLTDKLNSELISLNNTKPLTESTTTAKKTEEKAVDAEITGVAKTETSIETTAPTPPILTANADTAAIDVNANNTTVTKPASQNGNQAMVRPVNGEIINGFSDGELVKSQTLNVWKTHDGVDIAGAVGEKVKSMTTGKVTKVYDDPMLGATVIVDHGNGLEGYYSNLSKDMAIAEGDSVSAGTIIGTIGTTAESEINEAPHMHFAVKKNGIWIDPISLISGEGS